MKSTFLRFRDPDEALIRGQAIQGSWLRYKGDIQQNVQPLLAVLLWIHLSIGSSIFSTTYCMQRL